MEEKIYTTSKSLINFLVRLLREGNYVFRGVSRKTDLLPKINRFYKDKVLYDLSKNEGELLQHFKTNSFTYINGNFNQIDIVAYAQHYGIPTRLIDWTTDPYVALYFAIKNNIDPFDGIYKIYYTKITDHIVLNRDITGITYDRESYINHQWNSLVNEIKDKEVLIQKLIASGESTTLKYGNLNFTKDSLVFYDSPPSNPRLIAQQGLFSIPTSISNDNAQKEIEKVTEVIEIKITTDERESLLKYLDNMRYNQIRLFPDVQNISEYIVNTIVESKNKL